MRCPEKLSYQVVEMPQSLGRAGNPPNYEQTLPNPAEACGGWRGVAGRKRVELGCRERPIKGGFRYAFLGREYSRSGRMQCVID